MQPTTVNVYQVNVILDATTLQFSYTGDVVYLPQLGPNGPLPGPSVPIIAIPSGIHIVNFTLETTNLPNNTPGAVFTTEPLDPEEQPTLYPVVFTGTGSSSATPVLHPANYAPNIWWAGDYCSLLVININHTPNQADPRACIVKVLYNNAVLQSDPTIINDPPAQGSGS